MIDAGEEENLPDIRSFLSSNNIQKIDTFIISHFDKDHVGGAAGIVNEYEIGEVYLTAFEKDTTYTQNFFAALSEKGLEPRRLTENTTVALSDAVLTLMPPKATSYKDKEDNNASLVVLASLGESRLLFCGDAMEARIDELLTEDIGHIDFIKIPYHGKALGNLDALLDKTTPSACAITCSKKNPPADSTLALLEEKGIETHLTDNGTVHVTVTSRAVSIS